MAEWVVTNMSELDLAPVTMVGHSMGGLVALEVAANSPAMVERVVFFGTATEIGVAPALQAAADAHRPEAIAMVIGWSYPPRARLGGHPEPGLWQTGLSASLMERELVNLGPDLAATNAYQGGRQACAGLKVPSLLIAGGLDRMVSMAATKDLAAAIQGSDLVVLGDAGHMMLTDSPEAVRRLLAGFIPSA
jgi:pimeloyl-ACP methyl ester carboxylesterase